MTTRTASRAIFTLTDDAGNEAESLSFVQIPECDE